MMNPFKNNCWLVCCTYAFVVLAASHRISAEEPSVAGPPETGQQLGSVDFRPTPERPLGWRGDWTGRFPGATPPKSWSRRTKGSTTDIRYQADKPGGEPGVESHALEYFTIKEWLVAGPFAADDPAANITRDFLQGEDEVEPARGAAAGNAKWRFLRVGIETQSRHYHNEGTCGESNVDFVYMFGDLPETVADEKPAASLDNKVAYAHTYFYSPAATRIMLRMNYSAAALEVRVNGNKVKIEQQQPVEIAVEKGWNRLLVKLASSQAVAATGQNSWISRWLFAAYLEPALPISYESKNIGWMTKMTGRSMSQPIVVGDKIFVGSGMTDLLCLDKKTGRILWLQSNTPYDAMSDADRATPEIKEKVKPLVALLNTLNQEAVSAINSAVSPNGLSSDDVTEIDKTLKDKADAERAVHDAFKSISRKKYPQMYKNEVSSSNATPLSDGKFVYWTCGGGMKGTGSYVVACFDLDGKRVWSWHDGGALGSAEHGAHYSPNLSDGKLIYAAHMTLLALDAKTGKEVWRSSPDDWQNGGHGSSSPQIIKVGDENAVLHNRYLHRVSDGTVICPSELDVWGVLTPIVEQNIMYNPCRWRGWKAPAGFVAVSPPDHAGPDAKCKTVLALDGNDVTMPTRSPGSVFTVASPLYLDGVVYSIEMGGGLAAVDTVAGKALFRQYLDGYNRYNRYLYGVSASPALAGQHIFITDDAGYTHIIEPGAKLKEVNQNLIENIHLSGLGGNPCKQESFYTSPFFEGPAMYLRGEEYLYCIREE
ncbi:MAG: outer membrane protein assembly factor BamB [Pirellulaceae bacterium]|jgi:outer membrane protein assembly factor BamB